MFIIIKNNNNNNNNNNNLILECSRPFLCITTIYLLFKKHQIFIIERNKKIVDILKKIAATICLFKILLIFNC